MTATDVRSWVPSDTSSATLDAGIADALGDWWRAWFVVPMSAVCGLAVPVVRPIPLGETSWYLVEGRAIAIGLPAPGVARLGALALDLDWSAERPAAEIALFDEVGTECLDDLKRRLSSPLGLSGATKWSGPALQRQWHGASRRAEVSDRAGQVQIAIELSEPQFATMAKAQLAPRQPMPALDTLDGPVGALEVDLSALLGRCDLTLAELRDLAPGDTLLLDRRLDQSLPIFVEGSSADIGNATLVHAKEALSLHINQVASGTAK